MRLAATVINRSTDWVLQLINIVFLCLLFFLVNGTITTQEQREIALPRSLLSDAAKPPGDAVYIDANGAAKFRGLRMTVPQIAVILHREAGASAQARNHPIKVELVADRSLKAAKLVDIVSEFQGLDISTLGLITLKEEPH